MRKRLTALSAALAVLACALTLAHASARQAQGGKSRSSSPASPQPAAAATTNEWPERAKRWALVIGIDDYGDGQIAKLDGAANDAGMLADALVSNAGFPREQVKLLTTAQPASEQPRRNVILRALSNLRANVPKDGLVLFAFAGHGIERGGKSFLLPSDAEWSDDVELLRETAIEVARVGEMIRASGVGQVVLVLDACRNDPAPGRSGGDNPMSKGFADSFDFASHNSGVRAFAAIYATDVGHRAYEYSAKRQGYFTWALVEGLKGEAANERGEVTLASLVRYVQDAVPKYVRRDLGGEGRQRPYSVIEGYRAEELVISVAPKRAKESARADSFAGQPYADEVEFWKRIKESGNAEDFKAYLRDYPAGLFAEMAKSKVAELTPPAAVAENSAAEPPVDPAALAARRRVVLNALEGDAEHSENADYDSLLGHIAFAWAEKDWSTAINYAREAVKLAPSQPEGYRMLGTLLLYARNDFAGAERAMRAAIERGGSAAFIVYHDHTGNFSDYCEGTMFVTKTGVSFKAADGRDSFDTEDSNIKEAKINVQFGAELGAFHLKPAQSINGRLNFNFAPGTRNKAESQLIVRLIAAY